MLAVVPGAIWLTHTQSAQLGNARARCSKGDHKSYTAVIVRDRVLPTHTSAKLCDKLTIINRDHKDRLVAFGRHDSHISYDGVSERNLGPNQSLTVTLIRQGDYRFHDHFDDDVSGTFTVKQD